jgi:hypothetical protein
LSPLSFSSDAIRRHTSSENESGDKLPHSTHGQCEAGSGGQRLCAIGAVHG